ncbi:MAG: M55 family metallopeptidase [Candidatus Hodarchaeota archaeon]
MKIYISADLEGISGINQYDNKLEREYGDYQKKYRWGKLMTAEVNAAIEGALDAGATKIVVLDNHGSSNTILIEELNSAAELIQCQQLPTALPFLDGTFEAAIFIGHHAMSGNPRGILNHTYSRRVLKVQINDVIYGEIGINAAIAGSFGVPLVFVSGDTEAVEEAQSLIQNIEFAVVRDSLSTFCAKNLSPVKAQQLVRNGVKKAIERRKDIRPFRIDPPYKLVVEYKSFWVAPARLLIRRHFSKSRLTGLNKLEYRGDDLAVVWDKFIT